MDAMDIVIKRTGMDETDADFYIAMAQERIKASIGDDAVNNLTAYKLAVADIAVLYYQMDTSVQQSSGMLGYSSQSYTEGDVKETVEGMTGSAIRSTYDADIQSVLDNLAEQVSDAGKVVFL